MAALKSETVAASEAKAEDTNNDTESMDDLMERVERVQREYALMKNGFRDTITELGAKIEKEMLRSSRCNAANRRDTDTEEKSEGTGYGLLHAECPEEVYSDSQTIKQSALKLAKLLQSSKHTVFHTGAGVSTAAKLPDYRGPQGVWTLRAKGLKPRFEITLDQAVPTFSHRAFVELMKNDLLHFLVSTNVDGLHRRSGIPRDKMAELHGNIFREICPECGAEYLRAFDTTKNCLPRIRKTGRLCTAPKCDGKLVDSIINFGETLPAEELRNAVEQSQRADLCVVLGSSMSVAPACDIPNECWTSKQIADDDGGKAQRGRMVIVNLQRTDYDHYCDLSGGFRVGAKIDEFMALVMDALSLSVDEWPSDKVYLNEIEEEMASIRVDPEFGAANADPSTFDFDSLKLKLKMKLKRKAE